MYLGHRILQKPEMGLFILQWALHGLNFSAQSTNSLENVLDRPSAVLVRSYQLVPGTWYSGRFFLPFLALYFWKQHRLYFLDPFLVKWMKRRLLLPLGAVTAIHPDRGDATEKEGGRSIDDSFRGR